MEYFKLNKYSSIDENILYIAKKVYDILAEKDRKLNDLIDEYGIRNNINVGINLESSLYLAITFLFMTDKMSVRNGKLSIQKEVKR